VIEGPADGQRGFGSIAACSLTAPRPGNSTTLACMTAMKLRNNSWHVWNSTGTASEAFRADLDDGAIALRLGTETLGQATIPVAKGDWTQSDPISHDGKILVLAASADARGRIDCSLFVDGVSVTSGRTIEAVRTDPGNQTARAALFWPPRDPVLFGLAFVRFGPIFGLIIIAKFVGANLSWALAGPLLVLTLLFVVWALVADYIATRLVRRVSQIRRKAWAIAAILVTYYAALYAWLMVLVVLLITPRVQH
jgi:hypothetical protein